MKWALLIVDMLRDNVRSESHGGIAAEARKIVPAIQQLRESFRAAGQPVIYACDSFLPQDLLFQGKLCPHALRGSEGAKPIAELEPAEGEMLLEKRSMSSFFRTDLDLTLRVLGVEGIAVTGISTAVCVLLTAFDGVANGFRAVILEDCTAAHKPEVHQAVLDLYRRNSLYPVLRVMAASDFCREEL